MDSSRPLFMGRKAVEKKARRSRWGKSVVSKSSVGVASLRDVFTGIRYPLHPIDGLTGEAGWCIQELTHCLRVSPKGHGALSPTTRKRAASPGNSS